MEALWERLGQDGFGTDEHMPYWAEIWPASLLLAAWLGARRSMIAGRRCLDLGCGMERLSILCENEVIGVDDLPRKILDTAGVVLPPVTLAGATPGFRWPRLTDLADNAMT